MKMFALIFCVVGCFLCTDQFSARAADGHPNVLVIITDEHNFRTLGCYRDTLSTEQAEMWGPGSVVETPNFDRLAKEGVLCTRAYATAPVCSPCRAAMITGMYPQNTGVPTNNAKLRGDVPTLAKIMAKNGYQTSFVGKWHLGGDGKPEWAPTIDGGFENKTFMFNRGHWKKFAQTNTGAKVAASNKAGSPSYDVANADEKSFATDFLTDRAIEAMAQAGDQPFLTVVSYPDPHGPNTVRAPYDRMYGHLRFLPPRTYGLDDVTSPKWLGNEKKHAVFRGALMSQYFGMVKCIDDNLGRIFTALEKSGQLDSTIIMMTSDHGDLCYEHDRLNKGNPYEGSARVPMLIRFPGRIAAGKIYTQPIGTVDVTPTLLGLTRVKTDDEFEGRDLAEQLLQRGAGQGGQVTFLRNSGTNPLWVCAVDERFKLVLSVNDRPWLFDAEQDPDELLNFYRRPGSGEATRRLAKALQQYGNQRRDAYLRHPAIAASLKKCLLPENIDR
ncbi:sulfatase [bacterium]|nr:sulfatase [bacterium]